VSVLDGEGNDDRRTARICATVNTAILNALRRSGNQHVKDEDYRSEDDYLPSIKREPIKPTIQTWDEMKENLGWR